MIQTYFKQSEDGSFISFEMKGHADSGPYGYDLVCAACSALSINTVNSIHELAGYTPIYEMESGYLYVETPDKLDDKSREITDVLIKSLYVGLTTIEAENKQFIQVHCDKGGASSC